MDIPGIMALSIPIVAIIVGGGVAIARLLIKHRERMVMIEMGMHPDYPPLEVDGTVSETAGEGPGVRTDPAAPTTRLQ